MELADLPHSIFDEKMKKRIMLSQIKVYSVPQTGGGTDSDSDSVDLSSLTFTFAKNDKQVPGWSSSITGWPTGSVDFNIPDADRPRVEAWLTGNYDNVTFPASSGLINAMTGSVKNLLVRYFNAASAIDLFTSPFKIFPVLILTDGTVIPAGVPEIMVINAMAPVVAIESYFFHSSGIRTVSTIYNSPASISVASCWFSKQLIDAGISSIGIIAAPQADLIPSNIEVTKIASVREGGKSYKIFQYSRPEAVTVANEAMAQTDYRYISTLPVSCFEESDSFVQIPLDGILSNWKLLPRYVENNTPPVFDDYEDNFYPPYNPDVWQRNINIFTEPIDLGNAMEKKRITRVEIDGRFARDAVKITLYGSSNRENWIPIASGSYGWISGIANASFKWYCMAIIATFRPGDFFDALNFHYFI